MFRQVAEGVPGIHNGVSFPKAKKLCITNGHQGRQEYEVVRLPELELRGENPWRIRKQRVIPLWTEGNPLVTELMKGSKLIPN